MGRFELVVQKDEWGCGVACVASLLGISYSEAYGYLRDVKGESINGGKPGLEPHHIALMLKEQSVKVVMDWDESRDFPEGTIVCIEGSEPYDGGHYILMTPDRRWMDPWHNMGKKPRSACFRKEYPDGCFFLFALVPEVG